VQRFVRVGLVALALALAPGSAQAEWQLKPFGGITFGGDTTFVEDLDSAAGKPKLNLGVSALWLGEVVGVEGDVATTAGFFSGDPDELTTLILRSHAATVTGNIVVAMPKRLSEYTLRPYAVGGFGVVHIGIADNQAALPTSLYRAVWDVGGGVTGFLSDVVGVNWDVRFFRTTSSVAETSRPAAEARLSFWRATMGFTFRL
jgi:hypothetical protein